MTSLLIIDDCLLWTSALERCLADAPSVELLSAVPSIAMAREAIARHEPSVIAIRVGSADIQIRPLCRDLIRDAPALRALAYSLTDYDPLDEAWALASGFKGYVGPYDGLEGFVCAILAIDAGGAYFVKPAGILEADESAADDVHVDRALRLLSAREIEVFRMTGHGLCCKEIAQQIGIHIKTVDTYRKRIRGKLGLRDSGELLRTAIRLNRPSAAA